MTLLRRHKTVLIALGIYWPAIFLLTHIPVPDIARQSGMSDKTMHVLAYFGLTFLTWFAVSPYERVTWRGRKVWLVFAVLAGYAAVDEFLQGISFLNRSIELLDFAANVGGVAAALVLLSIFRFWASLLILASVFIFSISNLSVLLARYPQFHLGILFHLTAYTAFTLIWIQWLERARGVAVHRIVGLLNSLWPPLVFLLLVKITSLLLHRSIDWIEVAAAVFGISSALLLSFLLFKLTRRQAF